MYRAAAKNEPSPLAGEGLHDAAPKNEPSPPVGEGRVRGTPRGKARCDAALARANAPRRFIPWQFNSLAAGLVLKMFVQSSPKQVCHTFGKVRHAVGDFVYGRGAELGLIHLQPR